MYYGLKSLQDGRTAYIPVENHSVVLRNLIDTDTAVERKNTGFKDRSRQEQYEINYVLGGTEMCIRYVHKFFRKMNGIKNQIRIIVLLSVPS